MNKMKSEFVSRRGVFTLFGLALASSLAIPAVVLTATDAEARIGNPGSAASLAGMNRRDRRRDRRYKKAPANPNAPTNSTVPMNPAVKQ
jgi:hypothetical protein